jgi:hypothetical protein
VVADLEVARRHLADPTGCGWLEHGLLAADVFPRAIQGVPAPNGVRITVGTGPFRHLELSDRDVVVAVDGVPVSSMEGLGIALSTAAKRLEFSLSVERTVGGGADPVHQGRRGRLKRSARRSPRGSASVRAP